MSCPICQRKPEAGFAPFCSKRCADVDLGNWLTGRYAIPAAAIDDENPADPDAETPPPTRRPQ